MHLYLLKGGLAKIHPTIPFSPSASLPLSSSFPLPSPSFSFSFNLWTQKREELILTGRFRKAYGVERPEQGLVKGARL